VALDPIRQLGHGHVVGDMVQEQFSTFDVACAQWQTVQLKEYLSADPGDALVPIDEGLIFGTRLNESCSFQRGRRIGFVSEYRLLWSGYGGCKAVGVSQLRLTDGLFVERDDVFFGEVLIGR
jgi:hypothetical protein